MEDSNNILNPNYVPEDYKVPHDIIELPSQGLLYPNKKSQVMSHEISHLYLFERSRDEIATLVYLMGWREETKTKNLIRITNSPRLKPKSLLDLSEDIADHFEYYLHYPQVY